MKKTLILLVVIVAAAVGAKVYVFRQKPIPLEVCVVRRGDVQATVSGTSAGTVRATMEAKVAPEMSGVVTRIHHREGSRVHRGDVLLELDRKDFFAQYVVACANLGVARSQLAQARLKEDWFRKERDRLRALYQASRGKENQIVSTQALDKAAMDLSVAEVDVQTALAAENQRMAERQVVLVNLSKSFLRAPFDGVITRLTVEQGDAVAIGRWCMELMDLSRVRIHVPVDEVDLGQIRLGNVVRVTSDAWPGKVFAGTVSEISPIITTTLDKNRTADLKVDVENPDQVLCVGMSADVVVVTDQTEGVLYVETKCVRGGDTVMRVEGNVARATKVKLGMSNWETVEVRDGLVEGDLVVDLLHVEEKGEIEGREVRPTVAEPVQQ